MLIGRAPDADVRIADAHVSLRHAELRLDASGHHVLVDLGSLNGTYVNGRRITAHTLSAGDEVRFGTTAWRRYDGTTLTPSSRSAPPPPSPPPGTDGIAVLPTLADETQDVAAPSGSGASRALVSVLVPTPLRPYLIGRDPQSDLVLDEPSVSRHHARVDLLPDNGHRLSDVRSANGTYVNGERIDERRLEPGDTVHIGPYILAYDGRTLSASEREVQGFQIDAVAVTREAGRARLLDQVSVTIRPNELVAFVGGSGAGKSTLLRALAGAIPPTSGTVYYNGADLYQALEAFQPVIGYVPQSDIIHADLPVHRALDYVAQLRLPPDLSVGERRARVDETLAEVDLTQRRENVIRTLSGGQAKRVSVAVELLANPKVLLLDEPTSGLDAGLDKRLMELFRRLADEGRTVIVVTHSVLHLDLCDRVVFLAPGGRLAYDGLPSGAPEHFGVADFADCYTAAEQQRDRIAPSPAPATPTRRVGGQSPARRAAFVRQFGLLSRRNLELFLRDRRNLALLLLQAPLIGAVLALVAPSAAWSSGAVPAVRAQQVAFSLANVAVWFGLINAAREITKERAIALRERTMGVRTVPYLLSKLVPMVALIVVQCAVLLAIVVQRVGLPSHGILLPPLLELLVTLSLTGIAAVAGALLISALVTNEDRAASLVPYLLIPQFLLAGVAFEITGNARLLEVLTMTHWGTSALGRTADVCGHVGGPLVCDAPGAVAYGRTAGGLLTSWAVLGVMAVVLLVGAGLALRRSSARRP